MNQSEDEKVRQYYLKKDKDFNQKIKHEMEKQEQQLNEYFKQYKRPISEDPSVIRRQDGTNRLKAISGSLSSIQMIFKFYHGFWNRVCKTPEEQQVLEWCRKVHAIGGSILKDKQRMGQQVGLLLPHPFRVNKFQGSQHADVYAAQPSYSRIIGRVIYWNHLRDNKLDLKMPKEVLVDECRMEQLGEHYELGHAALTDVQKYRMDKFK